MALGGRYARLFTLQAAAYTGASIEGLVDMGGIVDRGGRRSGRRRRRWTGTAGRRAAIDRRRPRRCEPADQVFVAPPPAT